MVLFLKKRHVKETTDCLHPGKPIRLFLTVSLFFFIVVSMSLSASAEWVDKIIDISVGAEYNDNVNNSYFDSVKIEDYLFLPSVSLGRVYQLGDFTRFSITGDLKGEFYKDLYSLNSGYMGTTLGISRKLGLGPYKPWLKFHGSGGWLTVNDRIRDSLLLETGVTLGKRLLERLDAQIGYLFDYRDAQGGVEVTPAISSDVFDQDGHTGFVQLNYLLLNDLLLSLGYAIRDGDVASTCNSEIAGMVIDSVDAISLDDAYHNVFDERPICTYRMRALTHRIQLGSVYAIDHHFSVNFRYSYLKGSASGWDYSTNKVNLSLNYSF